MSTEALDRAIAIATSGAALGRGIGVSKATISLWKKHPFTIPAESCMEIERFLKGAVRCEQLRPDINFDRYAGTPAAVQASSEA